MSLLTRFLHLFRTRGLEEDLDRELQFHLQELISANRKFGMTLEDSEEAAHRQFGSVDWARSGMLEARVMNRDVIAGVLIGLLLAGVPGAFLLLRERQSPPVAPGFYFPGEDGVTTPVVVHERKPQYTQAALTDRVAGMVQMRCVVQPDGVCSHIRVMQPGLRRDLDDEAVRALQAWRFQPATRQGMPVPALVTVEMTYTLR